MECAIPIAWSLISTSIFFFLILLYPCVHWCWKQGGNLLEDAHEQDQLDGDDQLAGDANTVPSHGVGKG